jgi:transcriptional regulator with XRE-family HTH domain
MSYFGEQIKSLRQAKEFSQKDFSTLLQTSQQNLSRWENGSFEPDLSTIVKIAQILETSTDYLLGIENEDGTKNYSTQPIMLKPPKTEIQSLYDTLSPKHQAQLLGYAEALAQSTASKKA